VSEYLLINGVITFSLALHPRFLSIRHRKIKLNYVVCAYRNE
jgi:hypothetical protein